MYPINSTTELDHSSYIGQQQPHVTSNIGPSGNNNADGQPVVYSCHYDTSNGIVTNEPQNTSQYQILPTPQTVQQRDPHFYQPLYLTTTTIDANRARQRQVVRSSPVYNNHLPTPQQTGFSSPGLQQRDGYLRNLLNTFGIHAPPLAANAAAAANLSIQQQQQYRAYTTAAYHAMLDQQMNQMSTFQSYVDNGVNVHIFNNYDDFHAWLYAWLIYFRGVQMGQQQQQ